MLTVLGIFEVVALGCSFFTLHPLNPRPLKFLLVIMSATMLAELLGKYFRTVLHKSNHNIYNISVLLIILLLISIFFQKLETASYKKFVKAALLVFICFSFANLLAIQGFKKFATYNYIIGGVFISIATILYFIEMIRVPKQVSLIKEPFFWLGAGVLLMCIPKSILYSVFEYLSYNTNARVSFAQTFSFLNTVLSAIFYTSISIACICRLIFRT